MAKRKVSCLHCRNKKVKCDGEHPCQRCEIRQTTCVYQKPGAVGRPPKNAVVNKLVLARSTTNPSVGATARFSLACREFIFENMSSTSLLASARYLHGSGNYSLEYYINNLFSMHFSEATTLSSFIKETKKELQLCNAAYVDAPTKVKVNDLTQHFNFLSSDTSNILMRRTSRLRLSFYSDLDFSTTALSYDHTNSFFEALSSHQLVINPLNSLPSQQAVRLIECFFAVHPYSFMLNKTLLLQSYWTDTVDPLLLSVVYGTTIYMSQLLDGKSLELWDALNGKKRNPFLNYAHILLSKASAEVSLSRYQAVVLLSLFEVIFGFPKKGTALFGVSFLMAARLGLLDNTLPQGLTEIERELLISAFWSAFQCTIRGSVEMKEVPRPLLASELHSYPPMNTKVSKSYQFDVESNNPRLYKSFNYVVEAFYLNSVISKISCEIMLALPQEYPCTASGAPDLIKRHFRDRVPPNTVPKLSEPQHSVKKILDNFEEFIEQNGLSLSILQKYTLDIVRLFYKICLRFLRESILNPDQRWVPFSVHQKCIPPDLDLTNVDNILAIHEALPEAFLLIEKTSTHLDDPQNFYSQPDFLPRGIIISGLDAAAQVLMYSYRLGQTPKIRQYLELTEAILSSPIVRLNWESADVVKADVSEFLEAHPVTLFDDDFEGSSIGSTDCVAISDDAILSSLNNSCSSTDPFLPFIQQNQIFDLIPTVSSNPWLIQEAMWLQQPNQIMIQPSLQVAPNVAPAPTSDQNQEEMTLSEQELNTILTSLL